MTGFKTLCAIAALSLTGLAACSTSKEEAAIPELKERTDGGFQINKLFKSLETAPDEFAVLTNKPLVVPENLSRVAELPRPNPGAPSALEPDPLSDARTVLLAPTEQRAVAATYSGAPSAAEQAMVAAAGPADPAIRQTMAAELDEYNAEQSLYLLDRIIPAARELRGAGQDGVINPELERRRLLGEVDENGEEIAVAPAEISTQPLEITPITVEPAPLPVETAPIYEPVQQATIENGILIQPSPDGNSELIYLPE